MMAERAVQHSLPSEFRSLYRLFLRANSAAVLHHSPSKLQANRLWRPVFDEAVFKIQTLQCRNISPAERARTVQWLYTWHKRVDRTLSILVNAAVSRGLAHKLTRNLIWLRRCHVSWVERSYYSHKPFWKPQLPPSSTQYQPYSLPAPGSKHHRALSTTRKSKLFDEQCSIAIGEVIKMAEGRHGIILARLRLKRWQQEWSS